MFKRYLLAITFCLSSIFFFSGILYSTTQKIYKTRYAFQKYNCVHCNAIYPQSFAKHQLCPIYIAIPTNLASHPYKNQTFPITILFLLNPLYRSNTDFFLHRFINTSIFLKRLLK